MPIKRYRLISVTLILTGLLIAALNPIAQAAEEPGLFAYKARYSIRKGGFKLANINIQLQRDGDQYHYISHSMTTGFVSMFRSDEIHETSKLAVRDGRIIPMHYYYERISKKPKKINLLFDWQARKAVNTVSGQEWTVENLPDSTVDKFSVQLASMLAARKNTKTMRFHYADKGQLKEYQFNIEGKEQVETELGEFEAIKVKRVRAKKKKRITYSWLAPELGYLLVRMQHVEPDGAKLDLVLEEFTRLDDKPARE